MRVNIHTCDHVIRRMTTRNKPLRENMTKKPINLDEYRKKKSNLKSAQEDIDNFQSDLSKMRSKAFTRLRNDINLLIKGSDAFHLLLADFHDDQNRKEIEVDMALDIMRPVTDRDNEEEYLFPTISFRMNRNNEKSFTTERLSLRDYIGDSDDSDDC